jgi:hypothetical protein
VSEPSEKCPSCVKGVMFTPFASFTDGTCGPAEIRCPDCGGTGQIPAWFAERVEAGKKLRAERQAAGLSLGEWCRRNSEDVVKRSGLERGFIR